jgi:hypothetical protein
MQYMVFTARMHQFHMNLVDNKPQREGRPVEEIIAEELEHISSKLDFSQSESERWVWVGILSLSL